MIEQDLDRPWIPEGTREFLVGDKVRIRLSAECCYVPLPLEGFVGHDSGEDGRLGKVIEFPRGWFMPHDGHTLAVRFDDPLPTPHRLYSPQFQGLYAPSELELLEAERA